MKEIILKVPDEFTDEQIEFIKKSAMSQIEAELKATLKISQADIHAVDVKINEVKTAMGIKIVKDDIKEEDNGKVI